MSILNPEITAFLADIGYLVKLLTRHRLLGQTANQPLSNFEPIKPWKYK